MLVHTPEKLSSFYTYIADSLDIPAHLYENAVVEYASVDTQKRPMMDV